MNKPNVTHVYQVRAPEGRMMATFHYLPQWRIDNMMTHLHSFVVSPSWLWFWYYCRKSHGGRYHACNQALWTKQIYANLVIEPRPLYTFCTNLSLNKTNSYLYKDLTTTIVTACDETALWRGNLRRESAKWQNFLTPSVEASRCRSTFHGNISHDYSKLLYIFLYLRTEKSGQLFLLTIWIKVGACYFHVWCAGATWSW